MFHFSPRNALLPSAAMTILLGLSACGGGGGSDPAPAESTTTTTASGAAAGAAAGTVTTTTTPATPPAAAGAVNITGLTDFRFQANTLVNFAVATPNTAVNVPITGLVAGDTVVGIDVRPATGQMYAFARADEPGAGPTGAARIYRIDPTTGAATAPIVVSGVTFDTATSASVDFNPVVDRLRVITFFGQSTAIDVTTGAATASPNVVGATTSTAAIAYNNSSFSATAPGSTILYRIDNQGAPDDLSTVVPASGVATTVGAIGPDLTEVQAFDIGGTSNDALAALRTGIPNGGNATPHSLYRINLTTGAATLVGTAATARIGGPAGLPLVDIAIRP